MVIKRFKMEKVKGEKMGLIANYMMIDESDLHEMMNLSSEERIEKIEELDEAGNEVYDMDKMWDGLHFLLTGVSASKPIDGNPLSEAVIGECVFDEVDEDADFISYINSDNLSSVIFAMEQANFEHLKQCFEPKLFNENNIYPDIWNDDKNEILEELSESFYDLLSFYKRAKKFAKYIVVSIY